MILENTLRLQSMAKHVVYPTIVEGYTKMCVRITFYVGIACGGLLLVLALISDFSSKHK